MCMPFFICLREYDNAIWEVIYIFQKCCDQDLLFANIEGVHACKNRSEMMI
jgi:hypothetical protein